MAKPMGDEGDPPPNALTSPDAIETEIVGGVDKESYDKNSIVNEYLCKHSMFVL